MPPENHGKKRAKRLNFHHQIGGPRGDFRQEIQVFFKKIQNNSNFSQNFCFISQFWTQKFLKKYQIKLKKYFFKID